jgi:hypothetical protein
MKEMLGEKVERRMRKMRVGLGRFDQNSWGRPVKSLRRPSKK